ncbi:SLBB domain-containing protein [Gammaproteobacteria bacterium]|nr:SLBB domain-containing protein [Gammaproteobacteria bacterium]
MFQLPKNAIFLRSLLLLILALASIADVKGQTPSKSVLSEEFLAGLPASVRDEIEVKNSVNEEIELENLFRSETSIDKNKIILQKLKKQVSALEKRFSGSENFNNANSLSIFGEAFFSSLQSSFMPVNVPNLGAEYIVDVGDSFKLLTTGKTNSEMELMVQRDGSLIIPQFGKVVVAGQSLIRAEESVQALLSSTSVGITSHLVLSKIRDVQILLLGGIESPGIYTLSGGSSILSALNVAGGISDKGSYRKIELRRNGATIQTIDLYDIFVSGFYNASLSLKSGDTIFVHPLSFRVPVSGGVNNPAIFEAMPGESASDLIEYAAGFSEDFYGYDKVMVSRVNLEDKFYIPLSQDQLANFQLKPRDSLLIPSFKNQIEPIKQVTIEGLVKRPGVYFINEGETLSSLIERVGGYKENAYVFGGAIFREDALEKERSFAQLNYADTLKFIVSNLGQANSSIPGNTLDMLAEELRSQQYSGRIITDFNLMKLKSNPQHDIILEDSDLIVIPPLQKTVYLFGEFRNPSNHTFEPGQNVQDYIKMAGGLKKSAYSELVVIDPDGKTNIYEKSILFSLNSIDIYPGSIIYAPRDIGKVTGVKYAATVSPILSSLALTIASLNSISD